MTEIPEEFVEEQVEELKNRDDVRAVAVFGSYARDPEGDHNDLDLWVVVKDDWRKRETRVINGIVVEIFFNSMEWSKNYLFSTRENVDNWWLNYHWFKNADVRYDPDDLFEQLEQKAEERKQEYLETGINKDETLYRIWDKKQDIETDDVGQKRYMMYQLFDYLLTKIYQLNSEVPVKDNYRIKKLKEFDGYFYKLAQEFLTSSSTMEKEQKLEKMVEHVTRGMGEPGPEWETEKEEFEE